MRDRHTLPVLLFIFVILAAGIVAAGGLLYRSQQARLQTEIEHNLIGIANLKVSELSEWRKERLEDAKVFYKNNAFSALVRRSIEGPQDLSLQEELRSWLGRVQVSYCYDQVTLLDASGNKWISFPDTEEPRSSITTDDAREAVRSGQLTFEDFRRNENTQKVYLRLFVPILDGQDGGHPLGVLMLRIDPNVYLYPFIQRWPTPIKTAETMLIRREGNEFVFLNNIKYQKNTALILHVSLDSTDFPAVKAALGQKGIVEGVDYRGVPVLTAARAVPDSPWLLVVKIDAAEVYAPMRKWIWLTVLVIGVLLFGAAATVGLFWRRQHAALYQEMYEAEHKHRAIVEASADGILMADVETKMLKYPNPALCRFLGYTEQELNTMTVADMLQKDTLHNSLAEFERLARHEGKGIAQDIPCLRKDGVVVYADINTTHATIGGRNCLVGVFRDTTERKRAQEYHEKLSAQRQGINQLQQSLLEPASLEVKLRKITDGIVRLFDADFCRIWLIRPGDLCQGKCIHAEAEDGPHACRCRDRCLHLLASSGRYTHIDGQSHRRVPYGCYKIGRIASGEDHKFLTNDAPNDPRVHNHRWARDLGLVSFAGYQIRIPGGDTMGVLALFAKHSIDESEDAMLDGLSATVAMVIRQAAAEETLREREEWYRTLFVEAIDGICLVDVETGLIIDCNQAQAALVGRDKAELIGRSYKILHPPVEDDGIYSPTFKQHLGDKAEQVLDTQVITKTGEIREVAIRAKTLNLAGKKVMQGLFRDITAQKRAEEALRKNEAMLSCILNALPLSVFWKDLECIYLGCNETFARGANLSPEDVVGKTDFDLPWSREDTEAYRADDREVMSLGRAKIHVIERQHRADDTFIWLDTTKIPLLDAEGRVYGVVGIYDDITARKRAELALHESERFAHSTLDALSSHLAILDETGTIVAINRAGREFAEANPPVLTNVCEGADYLSVCDAAVGPNSEDAKTIATHIRAIMRGEEKECAIEYTCHSPQEKRWFVVRVTRFPGDGAIRLVVAHENITQRKLAEEQALIFRRFAEASGQGLGMATLQGEVLYMNQTLLNMVDEVNLEAVCKKEIFEYYQAEFQERLQNDALPTVMSVGQWVGELPLISTKGKQTPTIENVFLIRDEEGRPLRLAVVITNITERKHMEDDLRKAKDAAEAANRAKSEFLANMSHEIRTPMTAILGYADLIFDENIGRTAREHIAVIKRNGEHLLGLISDILDLSKIETGKLQIKPTLCSPVRVVSEVASLMRGQAAVKQLELKTEFTGLLPETVLTDPLRLRQVLVNLVGNAIKFTDQGEVRLAVRLNTDNGRLGLCFDVTDTGIGMNEEQIGKLFMPFSQVDSSSTRKFGGTGLGLCISKHLAEVLGGDIEVRSAPGKGSTFIVTIDPGPLDGIKMNLNAQEGLVDYLPTMSTATPDKIVLHGRILLAEDGLDNQRLICLLLRRAGADVTAVENGQLAVEAALTARQAGEPFDVILMDMQMPVMDGYTATQQLRERGYTGPIIALTAHAMAENCQGCLNAGCNDFLPKPFQKRTLLEMVARHFTAEKEAKPLYAG